MKHLKKLSILLTLALLLTIFTACTPENSQPQPPTETHETTEATEDAQETTITVTDMTGRVITLDEPAERIVALTASDCEILCALGAGHTLVGRGEYCDYPAQVLEVPAVASGRETNLEQILALEPQVLLMNAMDQPKEQVDALEQAGIRVVVSDADDIAGTYQSIRLIGNIAGKAEEAEALIASMEETFSAIRQHPTDDVERTVYFEVSPLEYGLWAAGSNTFMNEIAQMMGLTNIFADVDGWAAVSEEQVLERDPDYIVTVAMYFGEGPTPEEEILSRQGWENVTAVKYGRILNLQNNELSRPGPRLTEGAELMYDLVYGNEE